MEIYYRMPEISLPLVQILINAECVTSRREAKRLLDQGAVDICDIKMTKDINENWENLFISMEPDASPISIRIGKRRELILLPPIYKEEDCSDTQ